MNEALLLHTGRRVAPLRSRPVSGRPRRNPRFAPVAVTVAAVAASAPFLLGILTAFTTRDAFAANGPGVLPELWTWDNFGEVLTGRAELAKAMLVTAAACLVLVAAQIPLSFAAAFAFAKLPFVGSRLLYGAFLGALMLPPAALVVPLYTMMNSAGLIGTFWALVLPFMFGSPYAIVLLRAHLESFPDELLDAAKLDGCGTVRTLTQIVAPLARPMLVLLTAITVVSEWNAFMWPNLIASPSMRTITVATAALQSDHQSNWPLVMAATTLAVIPMFALAVIVAAPLSRTALLSSSH